MRRLILMRHAKSDWGTGLEDHERHLNPRGKAAATALGRWLRDHAILPDCVLCSSAERTGQTLIGLGLPQSAKITFTRGLYLAEAEEMLAILKQCGQDCVLMIGHNPGIGEMAGRLVDNPPDHPQFYNYPTGASLVVGFDVESWNDIGWHQGQPIEFTVPRDLT